MLLGHPPRLERDGTVRTGHGRWNVEEAGLPAEEVELRVFGNGQYYGRFMLTPKPGSRPSLQARLVAVTLADQAGRALAARAPASGPTSEAGRTMSGVGRVIVGASGSPGSLQALRYGEAVARAHDTALVPVLAWTPPGGDRCVRPVSAARSGATSPASSSCPRSPRCGARSRPIRWCSLRASAARQAGCWSTPPAARAICWSWALAVRARWQAGLFQGDPVLRGPCRLPGARRPSARTGPRPRTWPARLDVLAPAADPRPGPARPGQASRLSQCAIGRDTRNRGKERPRFQLPLDQEAPAERCQRTGLSRRSGSVDWGLAARREVWSATAHRIEERGRRRAQC